MATPHPALDAAVQQFVHQPGVTPADVSALQAALSSDPDVSPHLSDGNDIRHGMRNVDRHTLAGGIGAPGATDVNC
jgi:hypothetical protein